MEHDPKSGCSKGQLLDITTGKCVPLTRRQGKAYTVIKNYLDEIRNDERKISEEVGVKPDDPVKDTRIVLDGGVVQLQYDGAGYDLFSYVSDGFNMEDIEAEFGKIKGKLGGRKGFVRYSETYRSELEKRLKKADPEFYIEDDSNWALNVAGTID